MVMRPRHGRIEAALLTCGVALVLFAHERLTDPRESCVRSKADRDVTACFDRSMCSVKTSMSEF